ncbi:syntaxin-17 [Erpetoichthys calabaricus]|uniref:Syntaxin-17 n=1 Tax=Erpetoichthys calabaricus TaxID=27687 RepID=A0A8C4SYB6_ERPCA|nr:syntaxin-17 [Erpetoichthys calabaricus]XP_028673236.1 syntaxin-17 [Erpetoichthys calabaricus]
MAGDVEKLSLRRLELPIQKFIKVAIPTDLERLKKHQINIEKYQRFKQWEKLHQEHINARRTVQQLRANVREMEKLCQRVRAEDALSLEKIINPIREQASSAVTEFLSLHAQSSEQLSLQDIDVNSLNSPLTRSHTTEGMCLGDPSVLDSVSHPLAQVQLPLPEIPEDQNAAESWETLEEDLMELNGLVNEFSMLVHSQQEKIDSIEDHVNSAAANVQEGTKNLGKAAKYKLAVLPVAGALIGGVVGGPIGLLAGFKVAGVAAAVSGGILGFAGGNFIQKRRKQQIEVNLKQLSSSCPDLKCQSEKKC